MVSMRRVLIIDTVLIIFLLVSIKYGILANLNSYILIHEIAMKGKMIS
jgi:hypothetical protein